MKQSLCILLLICALGVYAHDYTSQSVLQSGTWIKVQVQTTGLTKITYDQLKKQGLNPQNVRIYGYGGALLTEDFTKRKIDDLPEVPYYNAGDYILFWAQGTTNWIYNGSRYQHTENVYSTYGTYFLTDSKGTPTRINAEPNTANAVSTINLNHQTTYTDYQVWERDSVNLIDPNGADGAGREWYGESFNASQTRTFTFKTKDIIASEPLQVTVEAASTSFASAQMTVKIGEAQRAFSMPARPETTHYIKATTGSLNAVFTPLAAETQTVQLTYTTSRATAIGYLNYIELAVVRQLTLTDPVLLIREPRTATNNLYQITKATPQTQVWNITQLDDIQPVKTWLDNTTLQFVGGGEAQTYLVFDPQRITPNEVSIVGKVANQNLHSLRDVDMVILTNETLRQAAQILAQAHVEDGLKTTVVTAEEVYNEFSSGTPDATAYRWLMKMLWDTSTNKPQYLLLLGDGTFDNRALRGAVSGSHALLTYQARNSVNETAAFATDDYFAYLKDNEGVNEGRSEMMISVGRLPVSELAEATATVEKIIGYIRQTTYGNFKQQLCFLADDGDSGLHTREADEAAETARLLSPSMIVHKLYTDAYQQTTNASGESFPQAKAKLDNLLQKGLLYFDYSGHAGPNNLASEQMLTAKQVKTLTTNHLALWGLFTCNFAKFDSQVTSAGEAAVINPIGGALAVIASCRTVFAAQNTVLNVELAKQLFTPNEEGHYPLTIGQALQRAKNNLLGDENKLAYILLGDPAVRLHYPDDYQVQLAFDADTLTALSVNQLHGAIVTANGDTVKDFNGEVQLRVQDKLETLQTLDNDQTDPDKKTPVQYVDYPNTLFQGAAEVQKGEFALTLMIPQDIRYKIGNGRAVAYAYDEEHAEEAIGSTTNFTIGGSSNQLFTDTIGPELKLYLNNPAFANGDKTNSTPHFYADVYDEYGINTIGNGIGHDLTLILDNDPQQSFVLNDYFTAERNSYQAGQVSYRLSELTEGAHSLRFKAWDLLNNSAESSLDFTVVKDLQPILYSVVAYPNPVQAGQTLTIALNHDQPETLLAITLLVYNLQGQLIVNQTEEQHTKTAAYNIELSTHNLPAGIYPFRVQLQTTEGLQTTRTSKIIVR